MRSSEIRRLEHVAYRLAAADLESQMQASLHANLLQSHRFLQAGAFGLELRLDSDNAEVIP